MLYFDIFQYPLTANELYENSAITISKTDFDAELITLLEEGHIKQEDGFILSNNATEKDIQKRLHGNEGAREIMATAYAYSKKIGKFPFVEGVCLSGALSKNYYDEKGDIDFFIITKPGRLWICRTLLILRYKFLPAHKKKFWCTNYFIASDDLAIPDINVFTGTELAYLIPTINYGAYKKIVSKNLWYKKRFPNKNEAPDVNCIDTPQPFLKSAVETILSGNLGKWIDNKLLFFTLKHWRKRYTELAAEDFEVQFRARKNVCKRHTKGFQNKILTAWEEKQTWYENKFNVSLR